MKSSVCLRPLKQSVFLVLLSAHLHWAAERKCDGKEQPFCDANRGEQIDDNLKKSHLIPNDRQLVSESCLRAAVVEYSRLDIREDCRGSVEANLDIYEKISKIAHENGARMLVFPEDGLYAANAKTTEPCLENIPDPDTLDESDSNPCVAHKLKTFQNAPILTRLSCIAKHYELYLVANYGTKEQCDNGRVNDATVNATACPSKERDFMMLNTNVIFNPQGRFIKRYRKWHTYTEVFDKAPKLEHTYFDTPYGRFGLFTCFDIIYRDPAIDLVEDFHIDTAILPTWWFDEIPILSSIQFQDGWSATTGVNLLASNILKPSLGSTGSSIISGNNSLYVSQSAHDVTHRISKTKLLIANIASGSKANRSMCDDNFEPKMIDIDDNQTKDDYKYLNYKLLATDTFKTLDKIDETKTLCSGRFCCTLDYKLLDGTSQDQIKRLILIVRNTRRAGKFKWFEQVCALSVLEKPVEDTTELLRNITYDNLKGANFLRLSLRARFNTKYVFPSTAHDSSNLIGRRHRQLVCDEMGGDGLTESYNCQLELVPSTDSYSLRATKVYSFAMYGRVYGRDPVEIV